MMPSPTIENYLLAIYSLDYEQTEVIAARLTERLSVSAPTVSATIERMVRDGYVTVNAGHSIALTEKGRPLAERVARRHRLIERWLADMLHLDWAMLHEEAHRLEHAISPALEAKISEALGHPETCPHGNPIPGNVKHWSKVGMRQLASCDPGKRMQVVRISELVEDDAVLMAYLQQKRLVPGTFVQVEESPFDHVVVRIDEETVALDPEIAARIWVRAL